MLRGHQNLTCGVTWVEFGYIAFSCSMYFLRLRKMIYYFTEGSESLTKELLDSGVDEGCIIQ